MRKIVPYLTIAALAVMLAGCSKNKRPVSAFKVWGIDVSKHQSRVDWQSVMGRNPPDFVFLKATEGLLIVDPTYAGRARQLDSLGVLWGAYHFFGHRTSGREQARNFIRTARLHKGNLIPVLDIEPHRFMTDPKRSVKEAQAFCDEVHKEYGVNPIIYCSSNFYEAHLKEYFPCRKYVLWIADYRSEPDDKKWSFWQHTDSHNIEGIKSCVDRNVFDGGLDELKKLTIK